MLQALAKEEKAACNAAKAWANGKPALMWFHPSGCEINGPHFHSITHNTTNPKDEDSLFDVKPQATHSFRKVKGLMKKAGGYVRIELVDDIISMLAYLSQGDRIFFGGNKAYMMQDYYKKVWGPVTKGVVTLEALQAANRVAAVIEQIPEECEDEEEDDLEGLCGYKRKAESDDDDLFGDNNKKQCTGELDFDDDFTGVAANGHEKKCKQVSSKAKPGGIMNRMIDYLLNFMMITGVITEKGIMRDYINGNEGLKGIVLHLQFSRMFQKALDLYKLSVDETDVFTWYPQKPRKEGEPWYDTVTLLQEWCNEQKIDFMRFIFHVYVILNKMDPKINCLAMTGVSNAGKSFWMTSMYPTDINTVGVTGKSETFMWQDCVDKPLIVIEEALMTGTGLETFKVIAGGQDTKVDVKGRDSRVLKRTPVLVASNHSLWKLAHSQEQPIRNRCYMYSGLKDARCLHGLERFEVDKYMWYVILQYCKKFENIACEIANLECDVPDCELFDDWVAEVRAETEDKGLEPDV